MSVQDDLSSPGTSTGESLEEILGKLLRKEKLNYHTEIQRPDPMTGIDVYATYADTALSPSVGKLIRTWTQWRRTNMVSYKRGRAKEIVDAVKAKAEETRREKQLQEAMIGKATR